MKVLIACEESGVMRRAFRDRGFDAWSNDIVEADDSQQHHLKMDCRMAIHHDEWDMIIMHPPCTYLSVSGNRWYGKGMPRHDYRLNAIEWTRKLWAYATDVCDHVALENPVSVIFQHLNAPVQYVQPWQFGHKEMKKTGFALRGLPELKPVNPLVPPEPGTAEHTEWQKVWRMPPSPQRQKLRSRTYTGIAEACADQWGNYIKGGE